MGKKSDKKEQLSKDVVEKVEDAKRMVESSLDGKKTFSKKLLVKIVVLLLGVAALAVGGYYLYQQLQLSRAESSDRGMMIVELNDVQSDLEAQLASVSAELAALKAVDQLVRNDRLEATISAIEETYQGAVDVYEELLKLKEKSDDTEDFDDMFAQILVYLADRNYASASAQIKKLDTDVAAELADIASKFTIPKTVVQSNFAPGSGYSRQRVDTSVGSFMVDIVAADLASTRVIVDTASGGDCADNCPVLSLGDYVSRNGAYAGINGSYFCPASYPSCAGKTNSFDTLLMNKDKVYFNSDNNVYSTVPAAIFGSGWVRFVGASQQWGRDTSIDSMIANQPLLVSGGNNVFGGDGDPKKGSKAGRSFVANQGNTVYIGVVWSASVAEAAYVLDAMNMENALNLDSGGSTAFWFGGYKAGPGRNIPNAILFVNK